MSVVGFLAPNGNFTPCSSFEHMSMAMHLCKGMSVYGKDVECVNQYEAEQYLLDIGYVIFRARDVIFTPHCSKEYCQLLNVPDHYYANVLTEEQLKFIYQRDDELDWNNIDQVEHMNKIIRYDKSVKEMIIKDDDIVLNPCYQKEK